MTTWLRAVLGMSLAAIAAIAQARDASEALDLTTPRFFVTLVPHRGDAEGLPAAGERLAAPSFKLAARRRGRLEFAVQQRDVFAPGDRLQLRLASDAHLFALLLSEGGLAGAEEESLIAMVGLASRLRLTYDNGPWSFSLAAKRRFGDGDFNVRLTYAVRF